MTTQEPLIDLSRFFALPGEIRDKIYDLLLPESATKFFPSLATCAEVLSATRLSLASDASQRDLLAQVMREARERFFSKRTLELEMDCSSLRNGVSNVESALLFDIFNHVQMLVIRVNGMVRGRDIHEPHELEMRLKLLARSYALKEVTVGTWLEHKDHSRVCKVLELLLDAAKPVAKDLGSKLRFYLDSEYDFNTLTPFGRGHRERWKGSYDDLQRLTMRVVNEYKKKPYNT